MTCPFLKKGLRFEMKKCAPAERVDHREEMKEVVEAELH